MKIIRQHFEIIDSTNTWAKEQVNAFDRTALTLVTAAEQTGGRGRFKRKWISPPGVNVYATFCFFLDLNHLQFINIGHIPQLLALSTAEALESLHFQPKIKWPNDVLLSGKKVAGILCETTADENSNGRWIICGIGCNVNMPQTELIQIDRPATSLLVEAEAGRSFEVENILELILNHFHRDLSRFFETGFAPFFLEYQNRSYFKEGQIIRFHDNQKIVEGFFSQLNTDGSLTLRIREGEHELTKVYYAGEFL